MTYATRLVLRYACLHSAASYTPTTTQSVNTLVAPLVYKFPANTASTTVSYGSGGNKVGQTVTVKTAITYTIRIPGFSYTGPSFSFSESGVVVQ